MEFWKFQNSADGKEATLYIYGDIVTYDLGNYNWPDDVVPNKFKNELKELGDVDTIHVRINSGGGSVFAAYAIMNLLKAHKAQIITYNDAIAASAATIIAMAGDKIVSALGSIWMIHLPAVVIWDRLNVNDLDKLKNMLDTIGTNMVEIYHQRTGIDKAELGKMLEAETWLTGTEAMEKGFVDEVTDLEVDSEVESKLNVDGKTVIFNGVSVRLSSSDNRAEFVAMLSPAKPTEKVTTAIAVGSTTIEKPQPENINNSNNNEEEIMNLEELKAKHPELYNELFELGVAEGTTKGIEQGTTAERERIQEIEAMALPGMEDLTSKAKFESGISASDHAMEVVKAQKQKGVSFLADTVKDANDAVDDGDIPPAGETQDDATEETALLAYLKERGKTLR